jgi:guanosine-diphosphatase
MIPEGPGLTHTKGNVENTQPPPHDDSGLPVTKPTSPSNDPDLLKTVHCTKPYKSTLPLVQYALMIDAGSTGSRIHIYKFNNCGPSPMYEYEVFKQRQPGLSSYKGQPLKAAESLDELLDEAVRIVPKSLWKCTPVAVKATAGLRLLGALDSDEILQAVRLRIREKYEFNLKSDSDVVIMDGSDEGVFAWITANYLLNTIRSDSPAGTPSYAVLDLGGASTQIVFEPMFDEKRPDASLEPGEHKYDLDFGGKKRVLYQHSYLGYGLMKARESVHRLVEFLATTHDLEKGSIANPCLACGMTRNVNITDVHTSNKRLVTMDGADIGNFDACNRVVQLVMAKDA